METHLHGNALSLATGTTYDAVTSTGVTAHPVKKPYPKGGWRYIIPIAKGGAIEWVYEVEEEIECAPEQLANQAKQIGGTFENALLSYHEKRVEAYGGQLADAYRTDLTYRFYLMNRVASIASPTHKKHVQVSALMNLDEMALCPLPGSAEPSAHIERHIRIVPMDAAAIRNQDYRLFFTDTVPNRGGKYYFSRNSLNSPAGSLLLFQFEGHLVACARLIEKCKKPCTNEWGEQQGGYYILDSSSIRLAEPPLTLEDFRSIVPEFKDKRFSNAMHYIPARREDSILSAFGFSSDESSLELTSVVKADKEGKKAAYYTTKYERSPHNRQLAIEAHGAVCKACGFDFEKAYGELGRGFIEVHHIKPLSSLDGETEVNPKTDLVCLCSNCHRMIHRKRNDILSVEELSTIIKAAACETQ